MSSSNSSLPPELQTIAETYLRLLPPDQQAKAWDLLRLLARTAQERGISEALDLATKLTGLTKEQLLAYTPYLKQ